MSALPSSTDVDQKLWQRSTTVPPRWHDPPLLMRRPAVAADQRGRVFRLLGMMLALLGVIAGLLTWVDPVPKPLFIPLAVAAYRTRVMPVAAQAFDDRQALREGNYFPRTLVDAYASQDQAYLLKDLATLQTLPASESVVLYVSAFAAADSSGAVSLYPANANPDDRGTWLPLRTVLDNLRSCRADHKLLVLDIMRPLARLGEPGTPPGRLGTLADDVASRVEAELNAVPDPPRLVLCSCSPGEVSVTAPALGQTAFGYAVTEGLRGWADLPDALGRSDGRVSAKELAAFVSARVQRWAGRCALARQTPILYGDGPDFPLRALPHGTPEPHQEPPAPEAYPDWLKADWQLLDRWRAERNFQLAPRSFRQMEALVMRSEQRWRGGFPSEDVRKERQPYLDLLLAQLAHTRRQIEPVEPRTLAQARAQGLKPNPALTAALDQLLAKIDAQAKDLPPEKAAPARKTLVAEFSAKFKDRPHVEVAAAVFNRALASTLPRPETILVLDELARAQMPHPQFLETLVLQRLAGLAAQGAATWPAATVHRDLQATAWEAQVLSRPRTFAWVRGLLDQAIRLRHSGGLMLLSPGFAPLAEAERRIGEANDLFAAIVYHEHIIAHAQFTLDDARALAAAYVPYLEYQPRHERDWHAVVRAAIDLEAVLVPPAGEAPGAAGLRAISDTLRQRTEVLHSRCDDLRQPFTAAAVTEVMRRAQRPEAGPEIVQHIDALLSVPFVPAGARVHLWQAGRELEARLGAATLALDHAEDRQPLPDRVARADRDNLERVEYERGLRRARLGLGLLELADLAAKDLANLQADLRTATQARPGSSSLAALADRLRRAWAEQLPAQIAHAGSLLVADRLAWMVPPFDALTLLDVVQTRPRQQLLVEESRVLWSWLARWDHYRSHDSLSVSSFYFEGYREYVQLSGTEVPPQPHFLFNGTGDLRLSAAHPVADYQLRLTLVDAGTAKPAIQLRLFTPGSDWLKIAVPGQPAAHGTWPLALDDPDQPNTATVPLRLALNPDAAPLDGPVPRGFLVEASVDGQAFHFLVPVNLRPAQPHPEIILSADPHEATQPLGDLRLRPVNTPQAVYLYVRNPTEKSVNVVVQLNGSSALAPTKLTVPPQQVQRVVFPEVPAPPTTVATTVLPELHGPLLIRLLDADHASAVLDSREVRVAVALPREYVRVAGIQYAPGSANELSVQLQARTALSPPPCAAELVLPPQRIPGFLGARSGTFRGVLPADGSDLTLFARGLQFAEGAPDQGAVYVNIDNYARAFVFRTSFSAPNGPTTPQEEYQPALRLRADATALAGPQFPVTIEVDNAPTGATLDVALGLQSAGGFQSELVKHLPEARRRRIGFRPHSANGGLLFTATIEDWHLTLDTTLMIGPRLLRARLLDATGAVIRTAEQVITFGNTAPAGVQFVAPPAQALRGASVPLQALGIDATTGIASVAFFVGKPIDGKLPPNTATVAGTLAAGSKTLWSAALPLPAERLGPVDVSVQFVNGAGLSRFATTTVEALEKLPPVLGAITGTVREGPRPQAGLTVSLRDEKGKEVVKTTTRADGTFTFEKMLPGNYKLFVSKEVSGRKAEAAVTVAAGQTANVTLTLLL